MLNAQRELSKILHFNILILEIIQDIVLKPDLEI